MYENKAIVDEWRRVPESNRCTRICNPLHNHSTNPPIVRNIWIILTGFCLQGILAVAGVPLV